MPFRNLKRHPIKSFLIPLLGLTLATSSCSHYSSVSEKRLAYHGDTPAGQLIAGTLKHPAKLPLENLGHYLDAAAASELVLEKNPGDSQACADYNFAIARAFEVINEAGLEPWKAPLQCPRANGQTWVFSMKPDARPEHDLSNYRIVAADRYEFEGRLVVKGSRKEGLGAPLVIINKETFDPRKNDPFAQSSHLYYGMTAVVTFNGNQCVATLSDPLSTETIALEGHTYPLAADFTAPVALALAERKPRKKELGGLFKPDDFTSITRLARLQPYDPKKIPVLCIHGLGDSQATWAPLVESLRADATIRQNYQFWYFKYPSGNPYPLSAAILRKNLDDFNVRYAGHKKIVVIGHSMGGMISRVLMTDSGMALWNATYEKPPGEMPFSDETRKVMTDSLIFQHRKDIARVIFASPSHRGADMATNFFGRMGSKLIGGPKALLNGDTSVLELAKPNSTGTQLKKMPNSIDFLDPENRFVKTLDTLPLAKGIPFHTILGDQGKGGNLNHVKPVSTDGIVPYWSSHLDGAQSEIIIPSGHWTNQHPQGIAEVRRILHLHLGAK